jgi:hypothetical protein
MAASPWGDLGPPQLHRLDIYHDNQHEESYWWTGYKLNRRRGNVRDLEP